MRSTAFINDNQPGKVDQPPDSPCTSRFSTTVIEGQDVERTESYKYRGTVVHNKPTSESNTDMMNKSNNSVSSVSGNVPNSRLFPG